MSSIFQQTVQEYNQFDQYVEQYKQLVETDPSSLTDGSTLANEITAVAVNGKNSDFSLIEGTSWMVNFGQQFVSDLSVMIGSQTNSTLTTQNGQAVVVTDQNGNSVTEASIESGDVTSITFTANVLTEYGSFVRWDVPAGLNLSQAQTEIIYGVNAGGKVPRQIQVTLTGDAMKAFLAQAQASGIFSAATFSTSSLMNLFAGC